MASRHGSDDHYYYRYYLALPVSHTPSFPASVFTSKIPISTDIDRIIHDHHGEQHSILLLATNRCTCTIKIRQSSPTSDTINRIFAMRYDTCFLTSTRLRWFFGESDQGSRYACKGGLITHNTTMRNPTKSSTISNRVEDQRIPLKSDLFRPEAYRVEERE